MIAPGNPLLAEPTEPQARLLELIYRGREEAGCPNFERVDARRSGPMRRVGKQGDWPIFQYVQVLLHQEHGLDARAVIAESPSVSIHAGPGRYGWLRFDKPNAQSLQPEDKIGLTVSGMAWVARAEAEVAIFLEVLGFLLERDRALVPSPITVQTVEVRSAELQRRLEPRWNLREPELASIPDIIDREPATWHCQVQRRGDGGDWTARLSPFLRDYEGVNSANEYVERLVQMIAPPLPPPPPLHLSSLSLPEAIDYLNAVWRVHADKPLLRIARAEAAAKLALGCATADEFESRLSALCGILDALQIPQTDGDKKLVDLKAYLDAQLDPDAAARAGAAIDDLRACFDLRAWRQHPGTEERGLRGMRRLGIELPTPNWGEAWHDLQARATTALAALREEIDAI
jgi:hypothetical protein